VLADVPAEPLDAASGQGVPTPHVTDEGTSISAQVSVKKLTGHRITIACTPDETVEDLKQHIQDKDGIPIDQQRLIFSGKQLEDARELRNCGLSNGCTVHLVGRLRGC
jgi:hypothetical protein